MRRLALLVAVVGCGSEPAQVGLTLAGEYDAVGVVRVFSDGLNPDRLQTFALTLDGVQVSGGQALGQLQGQQGTAVALRGTFDADAKELQFDLVDATITSTVPERVAIGGTGDDALPRDGIADQLTGFIRAEMGLSYREGQFLGVSRYGGRPEPIDPGQVTAVDGGSGDIAITGAPGAAFPNGGVEVFRYTLARPDPVADVAKAAEDGSFSFTMTGVAGDVFLFRNSAAGRVSEARFVVAQ